MRKGLYLALVTAVFFTAFPCFSCGDKAPKPSVGLEFTVSEDESYVEVTGMGDCEDTAVVIPAKYEGLPVKAIGKKAFMGQENIKSVYLPNGIEKINAQAFSSCNSLEKVTLSSTLISIEYAAFYDCINLQNFALPKGLVRVGDFSFRGCEKITKLSLPDSVKELDYGAFAACTSLKTVKMSNR
jgi:hypothetical protein